MSKGGISKWRADVYFATRRQLNIAEGLGLTANVVLKGALSKSPNVFRAPYHDASIDHGRASAVSVCRSFTRGSSSDLQKARRSLLS